MYPENNKWHTRRHTQNGFTFSLSLPRASDCCHRLFWRCRNAGQKKDVLSAFSAALHIAIYWHRRVHWQKYTINNGVDKNHFRFILFIVIIPLCSGSWAKAVALCDSIHSHFSFDTICFFGCRCCCCSRCWRSRLPLREAFCPPSPHSKTTDSLESLQR